MIVPLANACAKPHTVMIIFEDTIIAFTAMCRPWWPKNITSFAIFEFEKRILLHIDRMVEYFDFPIGLFIPSSNVLLAAGPAPCRYNTRIRRRCKHKEEVGQDYQEYLTVD
jgi:hypothetical protein